MNCEKYFRCFYIFDKTVVCICIYVAQLICIKKMISILLRIQVLHSTFGILHAFMQLHKKYILLALRVGTGGASVVNAAYNRSMNHPNGEQQLPLLYRAR
jgi:hypothetical protein